VAFVDLGALKAAPHWREAASVSQPGRRLDLRLDLGDGLVLQLVRG
jgi:hypothetical protein